MPSRMRRPLALNPDIYTRLIREALPILPQTEADNERLIALMSAIDEADNPTPEEVAFSELLTILIGHFEEKHYALPPVPPHQIQSRLQQQNARPRDFGANRGDSLVGTKSKFRLLFAYNRCQPYADGLRRTARPLCLQLPQGSERP